MGEDNKIQLFENQPIRTAWNEELEEWYFSIIDVVAVLTESKDANAYWRKLKPFSTKSKLEKQSSNSFWTILQRKVLPFGYFCISYKTSKNNHLK